MSTINRTIKWFKFNVTTLTDEPQSPRLRLQLTTEFTSQTLLPPNFHFSPGRTEGCESPGGWQHLVLRLGALTGTPSCGAPGGGGSAALSRSVGPMAVKNPICVCLMINILYHTPLVVIIEHTFVSVVSCGARLTELRGALKSFFICG